MDEMGIKVGRVGKGGSVNVGRPTALGNPYFMENESMRDEVCDKYKVWFDQKVKDNDKPVTDMLTRLLKERIETGRLILGCYCTPKRCHVETIADYLRNQLRTIR